MEMKEILIMVCNMLDIDETVASENTSDKKTLSLLLRAFNNVISEISEEYLPFMHSEKVRSVNGVINFSTLEKRVQKVESIENEKGEKIKFSVGVNSVLIKGLDGEYLIKYSFIPDDVKFGETVEIPAQITKRALSYGVAGEYALMTERYDESVNYDAKFNTAMRIASRDKKERRLPYRGYL